MNLSNILHALLALIAQSVIGLSTSNWWAGAAFGGAFYFGREVAQFEAQRLLDFGKRAALFDSEGMPWYEGFKLTRWSRDAWFDLICPVGAVCALAYGVRYVA